MSRYSFVDALLFCFCYLTFLCSIVLTESTDDRNGQETLQFVQMVFRHGDKNPEMSFPNDPYNDESMWPGGWNYITDKGKRRLYEQGLYFRQRYPKLLSKQYSENEIYAISSEVDRTIISASAFLTGLYHDANLESQWNEDFHWEPIPVRTMEKKYDKYLDVTAPCPFMENTQLEFYNSQFGQNFLADNQEIVDYLAKHSGITEVNVFTVAQVILTLRIERANGFELPAWSDRVLESKALAGMEMVLCRELHKYKYWTFFRSGSFAQKLISNAEEFIRLKEKNKSDGKKMILFSAHDRTIVDLMLALNIYDSGIEQLPPFGATLIFELHRDQQKKYFFDVLYKNDSSVTPYKLEIPNCGSPCFVTNLKTVASGFMNGDWEENCKIKTTSPV